MNGVKWECFRDEAYYGLWAVRPVGENRWGHCFHVQTSEEGEGLRDLLNGFAAAWTDDIDKLAIEIGNARLLSVENDAEEAWNNACGSAIAIALKYKYGR